MYKFRSSMRLRGVCGVRGLCLDVRSDTTTCIPGLRNKKIHVAILSQMISTVGQTKYLAGF